MDSNDSYETTPLPTHTSVDGCSTCKTKALIEKDAPSSNIELMSTMMQRVALLEKTVKRQMHEIESKDIIISSQREKLRVTEEIRNEHLSEREDLERRCQQLQSQVNEMENFLGDYGLIWVGDEEDLFGDEQPHNSERDVWHQDTSAGRGFCMNFDLLLQRIRELNMLAGEGECFVQPTATGAQLVKKKSIQLRLYSNGIVMSGGPFRSYQEHSAQQCIQDIMDGHFPFEIQDRFPDGAPFEVHDKRDEEFTFGSPRGTFPGVGQAAGGKTTTSASLASPHFVPGKMERFLNKLPTVVVKDGRVIDFRDSQRAMTLGSVDPSSSNSAILVDTGALQAVRERPQTANTIRPTSAQNIITLKVRSEDGNLTYVLKMFSSETVGHLRKYLEKHRGAEQPDYKIISAYPQQQYEDNTRSLQSYGLTTNATLLLRLLTKVKKHP